MWWRRWFYLCFVSMSPAFHGTLRCSQTHYGAPTYYLVRECFKSELTVIAYGYQRSVSTCMEYAAQKRGLAFNYLAAENQLIDDVDEFEEYTCQVLDCAEFENSTTLVNDTRYDYYSFYADPLPTLNHTCVSSVGMFHIHTDPANYTMAAKTCRDGGGDLAFVLTERRTNGLSNAIAAHTNWTGSKIAYVGLDSVNKSGNYETPSGEPLNCFAFRAWAPAHPRRFLRPGYCVVLDANRMWRTVDCSRKLPFVCELYPFGPAVEYVDDSDEAFTCARNTLRIN